MCLSGPMASDSTMQVAIGSPQTSHSLSLFYVRHVLVGTMSFPRSEILSVADGDCGSLSHKCLFPPLKVVAQRLIVQQVSASPFFYSCD